MRMAKTKLNLMIVFRIQRVREQIASSNKNRFGGVAESGRYFHVAMKNRCMVCPVIEILDAALKLLANTFAKIIIAVRRGWLIVDKKPNIRILVGRNYLRAEQGLNFGFDG